MVAVARGWSCLGGEISSLGCPSIRIRAKSEVGRATRPGNFQVIDSSAAVIYPSKLISHELGHNLNLEHASLGLMTAGLGFGTEELFEDQVAQILQSPLVQTDANGQRYVTVQPIAIVGTPEPSTLLLLGSGLAGMLGIGRKKSVRTLP